MKRSLMITIALAGGLLTAQSASAKPRTSPTLEPFGQCDEVRDYLADAYGQQVAARLAQPRVRYGEGSPMGGSAPSGASAQKSSSASAASGPSTHTKTNVQVRGVDENDTVKTDGRYTYTVQARSVTITKIWPVEQTKVVGRIELGDHVAGQSLFLRGNRLVVFGSVYEPAEQPQNNRIGRYGYYRQPKFSGTRMLVVDVSSPEAPEVLRAEDYEGAMTQGRMIGDDVYFVYNSWLQAPPEVWELDQYDVGRSNAWLSGDAYTDRIAEIRPKVTRQVRRILSRSSMKELLPVRRVVRPDGRVIQVRQGLSCTDVHRAPVPSMRLVNVAHIDLDDATDRGNAAIFGDGWQIYASHDSLYVAGSTYGWSWWGGAVTDRDDWYKTTVHKFALRGDDGEPQYRASGRVDGWLLNQFSMDEFDGHFRIATTDWNVPGRESRIGNHLTVLEERGGKLVQTGAIRNLAPGERIYSMRMTGDVGYMVTFRQTDPLYTIDLSNPKKPKVLGELKINGFSSYIHPLGPDHLLTVGQDADDNGRVMGLHLQIFDVSDLRKPKRVHHQRISSERWSSWSPAMWDHHAFTFDASRNLLVLPVTSYSPEPYSGALVLKADPDEGFHEYGFLSQNGSLGQQWCVDVYAANASVCNTNSVPWYTAVNRSIIVDDYVVAIGQLGLTVHPWRRPGRVIASAQLLRPRDTGPRQW